MIRGILLQNSKSNLESISHNYVTIAYHQETYNQYMKLKILFLLL